MNSLISINYKFMDISPKRLIELILESKSTKGIEIYIDVNKENEIKYLIVIMSLMILYIN